MMEELIKSDNAAIVVLVAWVVFLIRDRAIERVEKAAVLELYRQKIAAIDKIVDGLRKIRSVLQMDQTGEFRLEDFTKR